MIAQPAYVIQMLHQQMEGTISEEGKGQLAAARLIYTDEEWLDMIAQAMETVNAPAAPSDWYPPVIRQLEGQEDNKTKRLRRNWTIAACAIIVLAGGGWLLTRLLWPPAEADFENTCKGIQTSHGIPPSWMGATIQLSDSTTLRPEYFTGGQRLDLTYMQLSKPNQGTLEIHSVPGQRFEGNVNNGYVEIRTRAKQQFRVVLPNRGTILLNAGSLLRIAYRGIDSVYYVFLRGQALVSLPPENGNHAGIIMETPMLRVHSIRGAFSILGMEQYSQATLVRGEAMVSTRDHQEKQILGEPGDQVKAAHEHTADGNEPLIFSVNRKTDITNSLIWTKAQRNYQDTDLRQFALELCLWYGLRIENIHCLRPNTKVSGSYCYLSTPDEIFPQMRQRGINVEERKGALAFCGGR